MRSIILRSQLKASLFVNGFNNFTNRSNNYKLRRNHTNAPSPLSILSEDEQFFKETVRKFSQDQIAPLIKKMDKEHKIDDELVKKLFENGFMAIEIDQEYGGSGSSFMSSTLTVEEIAKVDPSVSVLVDLQNTLGNNLLLKVGNKEQKEKYLPRLAQNTVSSFCLSEPSSGSDAFALKTTAKKDGDHYYINGTKMWISNSDIAGIFYVFANTDPSKGHKGVTCFIVERDQEGFTVAKKEDKLGMRASGTCVLHFDNVKVHKDNIVGEIGEGYKIAITYLNEGRIGIGAQMVGIAQGCLDHTIPYTLERKQFGSRIFDFQSMQHQIARAVTEVETARLMVYNTARLVEAGLPYIKEAAMAKYYASEVAGKVTSVCIDWMGGVGFTTDFPQEKFYRDCKVGPIYEGTTNMQLSTIAKFIKKEYEQ
ncbi:short/branched chain specific acyl-CoA dehydrogenase, mitochondrial [Melanaphis sacchari]|uniref:Short/branched chain specific acyl-CoA dehydrogenase, mitochondrial n=3 Tax=Melanaphis sacchari TaxID=742174 RepID=A0A2H8TSN6_9HEMI|nr:short/branched chain specific acyl-CoA dehydrogenase, mitochondrial [Melanaphis sacchari]